MKQSKFAFLLVVLLSMVDYKLFAYDIAVKNSDGVIIYYNYINDGKELEVTYNYIGYTKLDNGMYREEYKSYQDFKVIIIPEQVTYMNRTRKVTSIGNHAFHDSRDLTSIEIPNSITSIGYSAFHNCNNLKSVHISDLQAWCNISFKDNPIKYAHHLYLNGDELHELIIPKSVTSISDNAFYSCYSLISIIIPNSVISIGESAFLYCSGLTSITIPNSVTSIGNSAFYGCSGLTSVTIPNSVTSIGNSAFKYCSGLTSITIGSGVTSIGECAFSEADIPSVISLIKNPFKIEGKSSGNRTFSLNTFINATLYVPKGTIDKYKETEGWKDFVFIEDSGTPPTPDKCEKPTIGYINGKLTFACSTEGATYHYSINDSDIQAGSGSEVQLAVTYNISVYAAKEGCENSETATATLCWIDAEPTTEGISNNVAHVRAKAVMIQSNGNVVSVSGADRGTEISIYDIAGKKVGSSIATSDITKIATSLDSGSIAIIRIGEKAVKILIK